MRLSLRSFVLVGVVAALALVFAVAPHASSMPDGLEKVAADTGIDRHEESHALTGSPLADYGVAGIDDPGLGTGLAGALGIVATFALGAGLLAVVRLTARRATRSPDEVAR